MKEEEFSAEVVALKHPLRANFWVAHGQFFTTTLFFVPALAQEQSHNYELHLLDCDGEVINTLQLEYPGSDVGILELESLMSGCKLEGGFAHGQAVVTGAPGCRVMCHLHNSKSAGLAGQVTTFDDSASVALPVCFSRDHATLVALVNRSDEATAVTIKLVLGKRAPETSITLAPRASRLLGLETEFGVPSNLDSLGPRGLPGYLKLRSVQPVGVQLIDHFVGRESFRALT